MANGDVCVQEAEDGESMLLCLQLHVFVFKYYWSSCRFVLHVVYRLVF